MHPALKFFYIFLFIIVSVTSRADLRKVNDFQGYNLRIKSCSQGGYAVFSIDSLILNKFNDCGILLWSKKYTLTGVQTPLRDFISTSDGGFAFVTRILDNGINAVQVVKTDSSGTVLWSNIFRENDFNLFPYTIMENAANELFIYSNAEHVLNSPSYNMLMKISSSGNFMWTKFYSHGRIWGGAIVTSDQGILFRTGDIFVKTDASGNVQWSSSYSASTYHYKQALEVSDGYIFSAYNNTTFQYTFLKIDKSGNDAWGHRKNFNIIGIPPLLHLSPSGDVTCIFPYNNGVQDHLTIAGFDINMNPLWQQSADPVSLGFGVPSMTYSNSGKPLIAASGITDFMAGELQNDHAFPCTIIMPTISFINDNIQINPIVTTSLNSITLQLPQSVTVNTWNPSQSDLCKTPELFSLGPDTGICPGETLILENIHPFIFDHYLWSDGNLSPQVTVSDSGIYFVEAYNDCSLDIYHDTIHIGFKESLEFDLGEDLSLCENETVFLSAPQCSTCVFTWNTLSNDSIILVDTKGMYSLEVTIPNGCSTSDSIYIDINKCECSFYLPNAFTPNNDGLNENFKPVFDCEISDYQCSIFNRWGQIVFSATNPLTEWNGKSDGGVASDAVYAYVLNYKPIIKGIVQKEIIKSGYISLIR